MKILVAYDGTLQAKDALRYGLEKVKEQGGEVLALHVFDSGMFYGYDSHPRAREMAKAESNRYVEEARGLIADAGKGITASVKVEEGDLEEELMDLVKARRFDLLLCPPKYTSIVAKFRKLAAEEGKTVNEETIMNTTGRIKTAAVTLQ